VQRLLLVSGDLTVLAAVDASCGSVGISSAITSFLWVGPALLYMTAGGQVSLYAFASQSGVCSLCTESRNARTIYDCSCCMAYVMLHVVGASCGSVGISSTITSFLWEGPALLYMTSGGQMQFRYSNISEVVSAACAQEVYTLPHVVQLQLLQGLC
jgi:hypothetical protein